ncbi:MAG: hypothetical protein JW888_06370, partial [Pirellulales bacterium]|nr:hypothetical protein [Pirellulales bacterium]
MATPTELVDSLSGLLLAASWQAGLLVVLVLVLCRVFRRMPARWRCVLWMVVLARLLLPVVPPSPTSLLNLARLSAVPSAGPIHDRSITIVEPAPIPPRVEPVEANPLEAAPPQEPAFERAAAPGELAQLPVLVEQAASPIREASSVTWPNVLLLVWALGVLLLGVRSAAGMVRLKRILRRCCPVEEPSARSLLATCCRQMGVRRRVELLATDFAMAPALAGMFRPRVLVSRQTL